MSESNLTADTIWNVSQSMGMTPKDTIDYEMMYYENQGSNVVNDTNYRLWTTDVNSFYYLPSAMLQVDITTYQSDGSTQVTTANNTALASNGWMLFQDARLRVQDKELGHVQYPGKLCHVRNLVEAGRDYIETVGENSHYFLDSVSDTGDVSFSAYTEGTVVAEPAGMYHEVDYTLSGATGTVSTATKNPKFDPAFKRKVDRATSSDYSGTQKLFLPVSDIFPLLDLDRVVRGSKIEIELNKISNIKEAMFGALTDGTITINRIRLWIARVRPSFDALAKVEKQITAKPVVEHQYDNCRMYSINKTAASGEQNWQLVHKSNKPKQVYCFFQLAQRNTDARLNPLEFDLLGATGTAGSCNINRVELRANGKQLPNIVYDPSYDHSRLVQEIYRIGGNDIDLTASSLVTYKNWKTLFPLFAFDLSELESGSSYESRTQVVLDFIWNLNGTPPAAYNVYAMVVSEGQSSLDYSSGLTTIKTE